MSARTAGMLGGTRDRRPGRLEVAAVGRLHLALDGVALCGRAIEDADAYGEQAGLRAWNDGPLERCAQCARALTARVRRAENAAAGVSAGAGGSGAR